MCPAVAISLAILCVSAALLLFYVAKLIHLLRKLRKLNSLGDPEFRREIRQHNKE